MRAGGQRRNVRLARPVMLSAIAQGNRRQQGQEPQPTAVVCLPAGRPAPGVGYISKRERERERERERRAAAWRRSAYPLRTTGGSRDKSPSPRRRRACRRDGRPPALVISARERERERERERDLGGELRMADHSVLYFFFFVKRFYPFVNTPPHLELFPAPRRIRPPHSPGEPLTAKYPRLRASPRLRWLFWGVACPSSASARQENFFSRAARMLSKKKRDAASSTRRASRCP